MRCFHCEAPFTDGDFAEGNVVQCPNGDCRRVYHLRHGGTPIGECETEGCDVQLGDEYLVASRSAVLARPGTSEGALADLAGLADGVGFGLPQPRDHVPVDDRPAPGVRDGDLYLPGTDQAINIPGFGDLFVDGDGSVNSYSNGVLWQNGAILTVADVCVSGEDLRVRSTGAVVHARTSADYTRPRPATPDLGPLMALVTMTKVTGDIGYKAVRDERRAQWGTSAPYTLEVGDSRPDDQWKGFYVATDVEHAKLYKSVDGVILTINTKQEFTAYDITAIEFDALGFNEPEHMAYLVKAILGFGLDENLMEALAKRHCVLLGTDSPGVVELIIPYPLANQACAIAVWTED